ncbi:MAG TPA: hypothetical protein VMG34_07555 [Bacteroidota bacterium]|nr:hypothetical protein [Bacteroidota bacterium]
MFILLLLVNLLVALSVCYLIARIFRKPVQKILERLVGEEIYTAWSNYLIFAVYVVGISSGVRLWDLGKYIEPGSAGAPPMQLNADRWVLEVYRTIVGALEGDAWMLLVFFIFALMAFVIVKGLELRRQPVPSPEAPKKKGKP